MKDSRGRHEPKERKGFRKLVYFHHTGDPRNGTWQWKYGWNVVLYSPQGRKFLASRADLGITWDDDHDHAPITPSDIKKWIDHFGDEIPRPRCRKKPKTSFFSHGGRFIEVVRKPQANGTDQTDYRITSDGELVKEGDLPDKVSLESWIDAIKEELDEEDVRRVVMIMETMMEEGE